MRLLGMGVLLATLGFAAAIPGRSIHGTYVEARNADVYTGPCFANAEVGLIGQLAVFGWKIDNGAWQGTQLDGLSVVGVVRAKHTLGDVYQSAYPVKAVLIVDERANAEQRLALQGFARKMGGDLLQDVVKVHYQPIDIDFENNNVHSMKATLKAGEIASIRTRGLKDGDHICTNEEVWYRPLTKLDHAMPAFALAHKFAGDGLDTRWSSPEKRSSFVGTFVVPSE